MGSLNELPEAPSESCKIHGFHVALEDEQPASSYHLPIGSASGDILSDIDDLISSPSSGMHSKKVSKLLPYPGYVAVAFSLNCHVMELVWLHSFDSLNRADVILSLSEAVDMEAAMRSIVEVTSWMDCWTFAMKSLASPVVQ